MFSLIFAILSTLYAFHPSFLPFIIAIVPCFFLLSFLRPFLWPFLPAFFLVPHPSLLHSMHPLFFPSLPDFILPISFPPWTFFYLCSPSLRPFFLLPQAKKHSFSFQRHILNAAFIVFNIHLFRTAKKKSLYVIILSIMCLLLKCSCPRHWRKAESVCIMFSCINQLRDCLVQLFSFKVNTSTVHGNPIFVHGASSSTHISRILALRDDSLFTNTSLFHV